MSGNPASDKAAAGMRAVLPTRWWGWGDRDGTISDALLTELREHLGLGDRVISRPVALADVELPASRLSDAARTALEAQVGPEHVVSDRLQRVAHAAGKSYVDLLRLRAGRPLAVADAVVLPGSEADVAAVLTVCEAHSIAVIPFGGGTSVVGGVTPLPGKHAAVISLNLRRLDGVVEVNPLNQVARLRAGMRGPDAEAELNASGFTLGHFPQSFEYATIGGFAATRSAGQASCGYGRFDAMALGLRCVTPRGIVVVPAIPPNAAGPSILQLLLGSEGTLGVISEVAVHVRRQPVARWYEGWSLPDVGSGISALHRIAQQDGLPDVVRFSDAEETRLSLAVAGGSASGWLPRLLDWRGQTEPCLLIVGWEGEPVSISRRREAGIRVIREHGGVRLGRRAGETWRRNRFEAPYLRDPLLDRGVLVETLETATSWDQLFELRRDVAAALGKELGVGGSSPLPGCHISHVYPEGASLYFTVMARQEQDGVAQWERVKARICDLLVEHGATITHHHAVGTDHAPWLEREIGTEGIGLLRALKAQLDPAGIMNPGKLLT